MADNSWPEINRIVGEALELPEPERGACPRSDGYLENPPLPLDLRSHRTPAWDRGSP